MGHRVGTRRSQNWWENSSGFVEPSWGPGFFTRTTTNTTEEDIDMPESTSVAQEMAAASPGRPDPNSDKHGTMPNDEEIKRVGFLVGKLDADAEIPSRHMLFSGCHRMFQDAYRRGRRFANAQRLKVDGGG